MFSSLIKSADFEHIAVLAQLVEQLICNQPVVGSSPIDGSFFNFKVLGRYQRGQMGQTVNLLLRLRRFESYSPHFIFKEIEDK